MKLLLLMILLLLEFGFSTSMAAAQPRTQLSASPAITPRRACVLVFESPNFLYARLARGVLGRDPKNKVLTLAKPTDFLKCIQSGYSEIVIIAHGVYREDLSIPGQTPRFELGYIKEEKSTTGGTKQRSLKTFLNQIFALSYKELQQQKAQGKLTLKKLRLAACGLEYLVDSYPDLQKIIKDFALQVDLAPNPNWLQRQIVGTDKTPGQKTYPTGTWLAQSTSCEGAKTWTTYKNMFCQKDYWPSCDRKDADVCIPLEF
jgi:hypothetical protein